MKIFNKNKPAAPVGRRRQPIDAARPATPNPAFSYYAQRSYHSENTGRLDQAKAVERDQAIPASFVGQHGRLAGGLAVVAGLALIYCLILTPQSKIVLLQDGATAYFLQDASVYKQAAEQSLGTSLFNRNKITVDTASVRLSLLQDYPEIRSAAVALPLIGHQPQITIEPYKPSFILTTTGGTAFLLDATGRALATTSQITDIDQLKVPTLQDRSGLPVKLGSRALPSTTVSFVQTVVAALDAKQVKYSSLALPAAASELDVAITGTPYFVKFNLQADPLQQAGTYLAARQRLVADHVTVSQYFDVRVPERAYYK